MGWGGRNGRKRVRRYRGDLKAKKPFWYLTRREQDVQVDGTGLKRQEEEEAGRKGIQDYTVQNEENEQNSTKQAENC